MGGIRVLVVDDHPNVRSLLATILTHMDYRVDTASDGLKAIRMLAGASYDLVITDLKMPRMDGIAVLKHSREQYPGTDVMMISGHATIESAVEATRLGAYDYLTKPFHVDELKIKIGNWAEARALRRETERLSTIVSLMRLSRMLTGNLDLDSLSKQTVSLVEDTFRSRYACLMLVESSSGEGERRRQVVLLNSTNGRARPAWVTGEVLGYVINERKPWIGSAGGPDSGRSPDRGRGQSAICLPLCHHDEVIGVLSTARMPEDAPYTQEDVQLITVFGAQIAIALDNARAYRELKELNLGAITALVTAVEARDFYTRGHSERVARYAVAIARKIGLSPREIEDLHVAGLLHDIGKIGISDLILNKHESLTGEEYEVVKQHPRIGATIVEEIKPLQGIVPLIYHHHERYDGSGYPDGLAGEDIPLGARILAVADTVEAMTSSRAYRPNLSVEDSFELLNGGADGQLDPVLVAVFEHLWTSGELVLQPALGREASSTPVSQQLLALERPQSPVRGPRQALQGQKPEFLATGEVSAAGKTLYWEEESVRE
ncbi:MAG: HD domain-containing phosphohydrolase [Chloroflexota bacterium]|nr:response regulator [Anaerolineae bacterium]